MANAPELVTESGYLHSERDKLINFLKQYANIALAGTRGEPPRKYELEFNMRAYVPDEDGISVGRKHRILITLPLGFPQNAPKVEALSPMYHPALNEDDDSFAIAWITSFLRIRNCTLVLFSLERSCGALAQLGERLLCTQEVKSSILLISTNPQNKKGRRRTLKTE